MCLRSPERRMFSVDSRIQFCPALRRSLAYKTWCNLFTGLENVAATTEVSVDQRHKHKDVATTTEVSVDNRPKLKECGHYNSSFHG